MKGTKTTHERLDDLEARMDDLEGRHKSYLQHFSEARQERKRILDYLHSLDKKVDSLDKKVDSLDKKVDKRFDEIKKLLIKPVQ